MLRKSGKNTRKKVAAPLFSILGSLKCLLECLIMRFLTFFRSIGNSSVRVNLRTLGQPFAIPRDGLRDILLSPSSIEDKMHFPYCYSTSVQKIQLFLYSRIRFSRNHHYQIPHVVVKNSSSVFRKMYFLHRLLFFWSSLSRKSMSLWLTSRLFPCFAADLRTLLGCI